MAEKMKIYNTSNHIITIRDAGSQIRYKLMPGVNMDLPEKVIADILKSNHPHLTNKGVMISANKKSAPAIEAIPEKEMLKIIEETFDVGKLKSMSEETDSKKLKAAIADQIKTIEKG